MRLFSRVLTTHGPPAEIADWSARVAAHVNATTNFDVSVWQAMFGYPYGTIVFSSFVESRAAMLGDQMTLMADDTYLALGAEARDWIVPGSGTDMLRTIIHGTPPEEPPGIGSATHAVTATPANGRMLEAMEWGVKIADLYSEVTGASIGFLADAYGTFGQMTWLAGYPDLAAVDAGEEAIMGSQEYLSEINNAGDLFVPGSGVQRLLVRSA